VLVEAAGGLTRKLDIPGMLPSGRKNSMELSGVAGRGLDIPRLQMSSGQGKFVLWTVCPSGHFVVGDVMSEAAVEHADKAVPEGA
jgi:hypothetical protein